MLQNKQFIEFKQKFKYEIESLKKIIINKQNIAIIPHRSPDGDAIGSALALKKTINQFHGYCEIFCTDPAPNYTKFLNQSNQITPNLNTDIYKILIFVDCGSKNMSNFEQTIPDLFTNSRNFIINIDHHNTNENFGNINIVDSNSASTTEILFKIFKILNTEITKDIAQDLLTGIQFDTGGYKHPNTKPESLKIASQLTKIGANNKTIYQQLFKNINTNKLKLWGTILNKSYITKNKILTSIVTQQDIKEHNANSKDIEGIIDYLNSVPNKKFSLLLTEDTNSHVKASLRTINPKYDLSKIASIFGGGGHKMAAGFKIKAKIEPKNYWQIS